MGINELIDELERNVGLLEESYALNVEGNSDEAPKSKERLDRAKAILQDEKTYRDGINNDATRILELKRLYQEVNVIQKELEKDLTPEKRSSLTNRLSELQSIANQNLGVSIELDDIRAAIEETVFDFNRLNGNIDENEIEEDKKELQSILEEIAVAQAESGEDEELEDLAGKEGRLNVAEEKARRLQQLLVETTNLRTSLVNVGNTNGRHSAEYLELARKMKELESEIKDLVFDINECEMFFGYSPDFDENALNMDAIEDFVKSMNDEKQKLNAHKEKVQKQLTPLIEKRNRVLSKYGIAINTPQNIDFDRSQIETAFDSAVEKIKENHEKFVKYRKNGYAMQKTERIVEGTPVANEEKAEGDKKVEESKASKETSPTLIGGAGSRTSKATKEEKLKEPERTSKPKEEKLKEPERTSKSEGRVSARESENTSNNLPVKRKSFFDRMFGGAKKDAKDEEKESVSMPTNMELFMATNDDKIYIKDGKMSFFERNGDQLVRKERDVNYYIANPSKALDRAVDGLRKRMIDLYGKDALRKVCEDIKKENGGKDNEFTRLMSANPFKYTSAYRKFLKKEELDGKMTDPKSWKSPVVIENRIKVAMALDSAMTIREAVEALKNPSNAYRYNSDMTYVMQRGRTILSRAKPIEYKESTLEKMYAGKIQPRLGIEVKLDDAGKMRVSFDKERNREIQKEKSKEEIE